MLAGKRSRFTSRILAQDESEMNARDIMRKLWDRRGFLVTEERNVILCCE